MNTTLRTLGCTAALATALAPASATVPEVKYQFSLSDFGGGLPLLAFRVHLDRETGETFVLDDATVRIFNKSGMQTFAFGIAPEFGRPADVAVEPTGDILVAANGVSRRWCDPSEITFTSNARSVRAILILSDDAPATIFTVDHRVALRGCMNPCDDAAVRDHFLFGALFGGMSSFLFAYFSTSLRKSLILPASTVARSGVMTPTGYPL